jgi:hypothetical protein
MERRGNLIADKTIILRNADGISRLGFTQIPNSILESELITAGAKLTYVMLLRYAFHKGSCLPGQDTLAADMGMSRQSANKFIGELAQKGRHQREAPGPGPPQSLRSGPDGQGAVRAVAVDNPRPRNPDFKNPDIFMSNILTTCCRIFLK